MQEDLEMAKIKEEDLKEFTEKTSQIAYKAIEECNKAICDLSYKTLGITEQWKKDLISGIYNSHTEQIFGEILKLLTRNKHTLDSIPDDLYEPWYNEVRKFKIGTKYGIGSDCFTVTNRYVSSKDNRPYLILDDHIIAEVFEDPDGIEVAAFKRQAEFFVEELKAIDIVREPNV